MRILRLGLLLACAALSGCAGLNGHSPTPAADIGGGSHSDSMRAGDKIQVRLTGTPDDGFIIEFQIPQNGEISVPLLTESFNAIGRNPGDLAAEISQAYKTKGIYTTPNVTVIPEERYVSVGGDVRTPTRVLYTPDLTLLSAINSCGGFTDYAQRRSVRIIRGKQIIYVDAAAAAGNTGVDPALSPGDQVYVPRTMF